MRRPLTVAMTPCSLVGEGIAQGGGDGVRRVALDMGSQVQKFFFVNDFRMDRRHFEDTFRKGAGLVENDRLHAAEGVHEVGSLDEDTLAGSPADTAEERERDGDHEGAGAGHHQEHQRPVDPGGPLARDEGRDEGERDGQAHDDGRIDFRELRDEALALGLMFSCVLYEIQDLGCGGFAEDLGCFHAKDAGEIDTAGEDLVLRVYGSRDGLARERHGVQGGVPFQDDAVHRHFLTGLDDNDFALLDGFGGHGFEVAVPLHMGRIRTDVHEVGDRLPAPAFRNPFEQFTHLEEQHHEHRLRELRLRPRQEADDERPQRGDGHEEVLVQRLPMGQCLDRLLDGLPSHDEVRNEVNEQVSPCGPIGSLLDDDGRNEQHGRSGNLDQRLLRLALLLVMMVVMMTFVGVFVVVAVLVVAVAVGMLVMVLVLFVMMVFVYHGFSYFHDAKIHPPPCNRVAIDTVFLSSLAFKHL